MLTVWRLVEALPRFVDRFWFTFYLDPERSSDDVDDDGIRMLPAREPETPVYRWIYAALRTEILEGRLRPGSRLPSSRDLASQYRLSRGIILTAFEQLKSEGYIEGTIGSGSYVSKVLPEQLLNVTSGRAE